MSHAHLLLATSASATPGFWNWSLDTPCWLVIALGVMYSIGSLRTVTPARKRSAQRLRDLCMVLCVVALEIALASPIDALSDQLFWVHMVQHTILIVVAAPLFVLSAPWVRLWRFLPVAARRPLARGLVRGHAASPLRALARFIGRPIPSFAIFAVTLLAWHLPAAFDATLHSSFVHACEHTLFFVTAVLFWKQVIPSAPLRMRLDEPRRVAYLVGGMVVGWLLALVLALARSPLYPYYAHLPSRPGGLSALADQQLAAGVMWVPGSITFTIFLFIYIHRWLMPEGRAVGTATAGMLGGR